LIETILANKFPDLTKEMIMQLQVSFLPRDSDGGPTRGRTAWERKGKRGRTAKEKPESQFDLVTVVRNE
jgi:hypothetical protein